MNRTYSNRKKYEEAIKRVSSRVIKQSEPDITRFVVWIEGKPHIIGERINEIKDDKTISVISARLDDAGKTYSHIKDVIVCSCGCKINSSVNKISLCKICKKFVCQEHSFYWESKDLTFCKKPLCYIVGRTLQFISIIIQLFSFSLSNIFGIKGLSQPTSLCVKSADLDGDDDLKAIDFKRIERYNRRNLDRDFQ